MMGENQDLWQERGLREAVLRGDMTAWQVFYDRCFDALYAFVDFRTGHRRDLTDEVVQEVWMVAVRRMEVFDPARSSFGSWMRGIAKNVIREQRMKWDGKSNIESLSAAFVGTAPERSVGFPARFAESPNRSVELTERIGLALTALPARYRSVLQAKYEARMSVAEIARKRKESPKAVESRLTRAREAFRKVYVDLDEE